MEIFTIELDFRYSCWGKGLQKRLSDLGEGDSFEVHFDSNLVEGVKREPYSSYCGDLSDAVTLVLREVYSYNLESRRTPNESSLAKGLKEIVEDAYPEGFGVSIHGIPIVRQIEKIHQKRFQRGPIEVELYACNGEFLGIYTGGYSQHHSSIATLNYQPKDQTKQADDSVKQIEADKITKLCLRRLKKL